MNEEKRNRLIAAIVVNAVIFVFIIVSVIIYQIVQICVLSARKKELMEQYSALAAELEDDNSFLSRLETDEEFREIIIELGKLEQNK